MLWKMNHLRFHHFEHNSNPLLQHHELIDQQAHVSDDADIFMFSTVLRHSFLVLTAEALDGYQQALVQLVVGNSNNSPSPIARTAPW